MKAIPDQELLKPLWEGGEDGEVWEEEEEESRLQSSKKCLIQYTFLLKKPFMKHEHNLSLMPKFYVKKDVYKA
ncbi:MAG: hypothetical protein F6K40_06910 [Okeania sp. SIO3I5]|uniref:hypothetical protein n=1 Tax=Okeania sp. SIO3I5 TaxID=2607805 RepID=UPI0013BCC613|nr:hypothetical protein [Okeania sp. SIO3I5]NEQ36028.1 hypothetical protein [Okeania sp. SIO3I5]